LTVFIMEEQMGLASHGLAFALGYIFGRPDGRQQLVELRQQVTEFAKKPEVKQLGQRSLDLAGERVQAARSVVSAKLAGSGQDAGAAQQGSDSSGAASGKRGIWRRAGGVGSSRAQETPSVPDESVGSGPAGEATSGFGGTTPEEDTQAVITGIPAPPPAGRAHPPQAD
jgi:hypothetical protein